MEQDGGFACLFSNRKRSFRSLYSESDAEHDSGFLQPSDDAFADLLCVDVKLFDAAGSDEKRKKSCCCSRFDLQLVWIFAGTKSTGTTASQGGT